MAYWLDPNRKVQLEPDQQVQAAIRLFFDTFKRTGSATATCKEFHKQKIFFPRIIRSGPEKGEIVWGKIFHWKALEILHNPRYAGVYSFGKMRQRKKPNGKYAYKLVPRDEWITLIPQAHPGYISFEEFEHNQRRLKECAQAYGADRRKSPPREGSALLQGLVICKLCGNRMTIRYHQRKEQLDPVYVCQQDGIKNCERKCQYISGASIDKAISDLLLTTVSPMALQVALSVQEELRSRANESDAIRKQQVERARYEADVARQRFMHVDSANRLVASSLEADWNEKLRLLENTQEDYEKQSNHDQLLLSEKQRNDILSLSSDFSKLWIDPNVSQQERKRLVRLIIEDVTLRKSTNITLDVRFKGGATSTLQLPLPLSAGKLRKTRPEVIQEVDRLLDHCGHEEIARQLNKNGFKSGGGNSFNKAAVDHLCHVYNLESRRERQHARGLLTRSELAELINVPEWRIRQLLKKGYLSAYSFQHRALQIVIQDFSRYGSEKRKSVNMPSQKIWHCIANIESQKYMPRPRHHHDEGQQPSLRAAKIYFAEVRPVALSLFSW